MEHFNELTPAEHERLALLMEEASEVIQIIGKIMRHGYESHHPHQPESMTNRRTLSEEIGHFMHACDRIFKAGDVKEQDVDLFKHLKASKIERWLHHQKYEKGGE